MKVSYEDIMQIISRYLTRELMKTELEEDAEDDLVRKNRENS